MMTAQEPRSREYYAPFSLIFKEGDPGYCAYLIESGKVEISIQSHDQKPTVLDNITAGGIFGEMALIDSKQRMATARAVEPTTVIVISQSIMEDKLRNADPFIRGLLKILVRNLRDMGDKFAHSEKSLKT